MTMGYNSPQNRMMNRHQNIAMLIAAANLLLILLFPPFDQFTIATSRVPTFAGFSFYFTPPPYGVVNGGVLVLEAFVVLINAGIAWLLLADRPKGPRAPRVGYRNAVLIGTGVNLVVILMFPPFESVFALTNAVLPTFEGFYFIGSRQSGHFIVITLLYIEVGFVLANGALFWLLLRERPSQQLSPEQAYALAKKLQEKDAT
jgi:hypothetical protein